MPSYIIPERVEAAAESDRAGERFQVALRNNQRGDNYTILTVLFASVLFFTAMSERVRALRAQEILLGTALVSGVVGVILLAIFPKLV
jgi:class 3 adenylate cyclase